MAGTFNGKYEYDPNGVNRIINEKGNLFIALREVRWSEGKDFKMDLRNYKSDEEDDIPLKGISFNDDEADELVKVLIEEGFGDSDEITEAIITNRPDLCERLACCEGYDHDEAGVDARKRLFSRRMEYDETKMDEEEKDSDEYYDPRSLLEE